MIEIEIDGKKFAVEPGEMIIEVADRANIRIPRFCYHKKLSIAANCRMCLVDVEKSGKPLPACATPVTDGMIVRTHSAKALDAQQSVMEFLLMNHPLDCPICDQAGECELQDISMGYGQDLSRYHEGKRTVKDKSLGTLVGTDMTRCIQCTRCIRFTEEIAGLQELGTLGRGEMTEVGTYIEKGLVSELSGNVIDLCPVGALTSKPFRFTARAFELEQHASISPHDCAGSHLSFHTRRGEVMRAVPREHEAINETWLSDRDRFSYEALNSDERLLQPMIKEKGEWQVVDWATALNRAVSGITAVIAAHGPEQVGALLSPSSTMEEGYLLQKMMRLLGSDHIDHRLQQCDFSAQDQIATFPGLHLSLDALEEQDHLLFIGSHLLREQPIIAHRVRQASLKRTTLSVINPATYTFRCEIAHQAIVKPSAIPEVLGALVHALLAEGIQAPSEAVQALVSEIAVTPFAQQEAQALCRGEKKMLILGALALNHPEAGLIKQLADIIAQMTGAQVGLLTPGANSAGLWLAAAIPHRDVEMKQLAQPGLNAKTMLEAKLRAYLLLHVEPGLDSAYPAQATEALTSADCVIAITPYFCHTVAAYADVLLPAAAFSETSGTYVNAQGTWQRFKGAVSPKGDSRPAWKILRVLGNLFKLPHFMFESTDDIHDELKHHVHEKQKPVPHELPLPKHISKPLAGVEQLTAWPIYRADPMVRRAKALQLSPINELPAVYLSVELANRLHLSADSLVQISTSCSDGLWPVQLVDYLPDNTVYIPAGFGLSATLTHSSGAITLLRSEYS